MKLLLLIILLTLSLGIASAEVSPVDTGADMVHKGIDSFLYGIADDMYELGVGINSGGANVTDAGTTNAIFTVATFTYDPFEIGAVQDMQLNSAVIFVILMIIYIFLGAAGVLISRFMPSLSDMLTFVFGKNMAFRQYLTNLCIGLFVAMFSYISIRLILTLNYVLSHLIMAGVIESVAPSPSNVILYLMMAGCYLIMSIFFAWRMLVIGLVTAFALVLGLMFVFNATKRLANEIFCYFVVMVFMQSVIVAITAVGVKLIQPMAAVTSISPGPMAEISMYLVLDLLLVIVAFAMVIGVHRMVASGKKVIQVVM